MASIYDALLGNYGSEQDYLAQDPYYAMARGIGSIQYKPTTNEEALYMPALQGLITGALSGVGRENARQSQYEDLRSSPLIQALYQNSDTNPYASESAPSDWTSRSGKNDLILAAIQADALQRENERKAQAQSQLENSAALQGLNISDGNVSVIPGALESLRNVSLAREGLNPEDSSGFGKAGQTALLKERATASKADSAESVIKDAFDDIKNVDPVQQFNPLSTDYAKMNSAQSAIMTAIQSQWKGPMSDQDVKTVSGLIPGKLTNDQQADILESRLLGVLKANREGTPILDALGQNSTGTNSNASEKAAFIAELKSRGLGKEEARKIFNERFGG